MATSEENMQRQICFILLFLGLVLLLARQTAVTAMPQLAPAGGTTERVSIRTGGEEGRNDSYAADISADGRYVVFESAAGNLVSGDDNGDTDIFVHDRQTGATERVSVDSDGDEGNGDSRAPAISDDGRFVVFHSVATNLIDDDNNGFADVFYHDRETGDTKRANIVLDGETNDVSLNADVSADGRYIVFTSYASNLVGGDNNGVADIFRYDRVDKVMVRVSVDDNGAESNGDSDHASISDNGGHVAFESDASNLVSADGNTYRDVFVRDMGDNETERVSVRSNGEEGQGESHSAAISGDGKFVVFVSLAGNLHSDDDNPYADVFIHERSEGKTRLVSVSSEGEQTNANSSQPAVSDDGRYVAFDTKATTLIDEDTDGDRHVYVRDRQDNETVVVSVDSNGDLGNRDSSEAALSGDGLYVAFTSNATDLVSNDDNDDSDVFVHELVAPPPPPPPASLTVNHSTGAPGSVFAFTGTGFTPNEPVAIWVNGVFITTIQADGNGDFVFQLGTNPDTPLGGYYATVIQGSIERTAGFILVADAPLHSGTGVIYILPYGIAYSEFIHLPVVVR